MSDGQAWPLATWRRLLTEAMAEHGETLSDVVANTMTDEQMDVKFDDGFGGTKGIPFTVWTGRRVYFPAEYDGSEWVASVSRNPDGEATDHIGGG
jgi:hypothetical protein